MAKQDESDFELKTELKSATHKDIAQTCNQLAINYEENRHYDESSDFRYAAMEAKRLGYKSTFTRIFNLYWLYKWTSGYGESRLWATFILFCLIGAFAVFYNSPFAYFELPAELRQKDRETSETADTPANRFYKMNNSEGFTHSFAVASFQRPEPKPLII